jgi:hypothetical protein
MRMAFTGRLSASRSPRITAGTLASIMPNVVPATTAIEDLEARGNTDGRNLRLVTDFGEKEGNQGRG